MLKKLQDIVGVLRLPDETDEQMELRARRERPKGWDFSVQEVRKAAASAGTYSDSNLRDMRPVVSIGQTWYGPNSGEGEVMSFEKTDGGQTVAKLRPGTGCWHLYMLIGVDGRPEVDGWTYRAKVPTTGYRRVVGVGQIWDSIAYGQGEVKTIARDKSQQMLARLETADGIDLHMSIGDDGCPMFTDRWTYVSEPGRPVVEGGQTWADFGRNNPPVALVVGVAEDYFTYRYLDSTQVLTQSLGADRRPTSGWWRLCTPYGLPVDGKDGGTHAPVPFDPAVGQILRCTGLVPDFRGTPPIIGSEWTVESVVSSESGAKVKLRLNHDADLEGFQHVIDLDIKGSPAMYMANWWQLVSEAPVTTTPEQSWVTPRCGQTWHSRGEKHHRIEAYLYDKMEGSVAYFGRLSDRSCATLTVGELRAKWFYVSGPTTPETEQEAFLRVLELEVANVPEGLTKDEWRAVLINGTMSEARTTLGGGPGTMMVQDRPAQVRAFAASERRRVEFGWECWRNGEYTLAEVHGAIHAHPLRRASIPPKGER